jgi:hypothetical protein
MDLLEQVDHPVHQVQVEQVVHLVHQVQVDQVDHPVHRVEVIFIMEHQVQQFKFQVLVML